MPVLRSIRERFARERPLRGCPWALCLHITSETACLVRALQAGGASVALCASNPYATQHDVAAALRDEAEVYAGGPDDVGRRCCRGRRAGAADHARRRRRPAGALHAVRRSCWTACSAGPRRPPPASSGCARWRPRRPRSAGHRGQRGARREGAQRSLRHRPVRDGRHPARDEHPAGRPDRRGAGLRLDGARRRAGRARAAARP